MDYQLVLPYDHKQNIADKSVQTFKDYLIAVLCGTDVKFPMQLCTRRPKYRLVNITYKSCQSFLLAVTIQYCSILHVFPRQWYCHHHFCIHNSLVCIYCHHCRHTSQLISELNQPLYSTLTARPINQLIDQSSTSPIEVQHLQGNFNGKQCTFSQFASLIFGGEAGCTSIERRSTLLLTSSHKYPQESIIGQIKHQLSLQLLAPHLDMSIHDMWCRHTLNGTLNYAQNAISPSFWCRPSCHPPLGLRWS